MNAAPDLTGNPRRFVLFTTFYNARAYYPILAVLFLDLGLTLDQFVLLNFIWAGSIFLFEIPSGALADTWGRRPLLIISASLMVLEMLCLLLAPRNGGWLLFALCVLNRLFSGISEAAASGADEALAYDSLAETDRTEAWDGILAAAMRLRAVGTMLAMIVGGMLYDPAVLNRLLPASWQFSTSFAHRLPVALVLCQALVCLVLTLRMVEPPRNTMDNLARSFRATLGATLQTAKWVFTNPNTLVVVVLGLGIDSIVRNFATINSSYYRLIALPEWTFGFIGAAIGLLGWFIPSIALKLNTRYSSLGNLKIAGALTLLGLILLIPAWPVWGVIPAIFLMGTLGFVAFTTSRVLHREATSAQRATALSVKGLAFNLGYGAFSLGFSGLLTRLPKTSDGMGLQQALFWQTPFFALLMFGLLFWARRLTTRSA